MPKPSALTPDLLSSQPSTSGNTALEPRPITTAGTRQKKQPSPLQLRVSPAQAKEIKRAALEADQTISKFMLNCFYAYMKRPTA